MRADDLRAHVLISWMIGVSVCYCTFVIAAANPTLSRGVTFSHIGAPARHLAAAVGPTLLALVGTYFSGDIKTVTLKAGQRRVLLLLSYAYVASFTFITLAMLFVVGFGLDHDETRVSTVSCVNLVIPAVNHYLILTYVQPLVVAALFFLFGTSAQKARE